MTYAAEKIKQATLRAIDSLMTKTSQHIFPSHLPQHCSISAMIEGPLNTKH